MLDMSDERVGLPDEIARESCRLRSLEECEEPRLERVEERHVGVKEKSGSNDLRRLHVLQYSV